MKGSCKTEYSEEDLVLDSFQKRRDRAKRAWSVAIPAFLLLLFLYVAIFTPGKIPAFMNNAYAVEPTPTATPPLTISTPAPLLMPPPAPGAPPEGEIHIDMENVPVDSAIIRLGDEEEGVKALQKRLMELGYFDNDELTTLYGPVTENAVKLFQRVQGLEQSGLLDGFLWDLIFAERVIPYHMKSGDEGEDIKSLQARLHELGYFSEKQTGLFGSATEDAVKIYQKRNKLEETGVMQLKDIDLLYSFDARPRVDPTPKPTATPLKGSAASSAAGLIQCAKKELGKPYVWGATGPNSYDCSGFLYHCLVAVNRDVGRVKAVHYSKFADWRPINKLSDCIAGDFLFFKSDTNEEVDHAGIYLGNNEFIHASFSAGKVKKDSLTDYFRRNFVIARRVFG